MMQLMINIVHLAEPFTSTSMKLHFCAYAAPESEVLEIGPYREICQSPGSSNLKYGNPGAAGGSIDDDDIVDGGTI